ncbi:N-acyl homoserine lactonase family protein [Dactylosporangium sp. AC04546]|uniref:N-acyl homoserine lactonase family protein n=1 Tax=Dactylosporangium sp. AC04546 TaxID=2862460 RepID=UPI001EDCC89F|nr:N-acyl homoserine lactonase family protein [Dactylosporangium sp. AC04546]WVK89141.1 N-acyl homoserine lactonase family protein [Dactylosporangium sp. AC04546]
MTASDRYQVTIVKYGTRRTVRSDVYLNHHIYSEPDGPIGMDYFFWLIRNSEHTIVVDTGFSATGGARRRRTTLVEPAAAFDALGVDRDAGPPVVITHAHYDHIGNVELFPASPLTIAAAEYDFWTGPYADRVLLHHSVEDTELDHLRQAERQSRLRTFSDEVDLAPGVRVIRVGGHTPGQSVVTVNTAAGVVLLASDAVHYYEEYERSMPFTQVANLLDMYAGFERIRAMLGAGEIHHLVPGHDPDTLGRFTPVTGALAGLAATIGEASR